MRAVFRSVTRLFFTTQRPLRRLSSGLIVGLIVGSVLLGALYKNWFSETRTRLQDNLYNPRPTRGIVSIIAIDDPSLAAYGRTTSEWPRSIHADLINILVAANARVIAFDVLFAQPTPDDAALSEAMQQSRRVGVIQPIVGSQEAVAKTQAGNLITYDYFVHPTPVLEEAARGLGHASVVPDGDGQVRRIPLFVLEDEQPVPALGLAAYIEYLRQLPEMVEIDTNVVRFANRDLYTDDFGRMLIYYFGPPSHPGQPGSTFPVYSYVDVIEGRVPPEVFADQIVLIGALDASGEPDSYATPSTSTGAVMYGVEIHANVIETIHQSLPSFQASFDWKLDLGLFKIQLYEGKTSFPLREQPLEEQELITFLLAIGAGLLLPFLRWYIGLPLVVLGYAVYYFWASVSFTVWGRIVEIAFPAAALGFTFLGTMISVYVFEERRRGQINDLFSRYVSSEIAQKIVEAFDHGKLELGGEEREITVLFADVRGFTPLSEGLPPHEVVRLLNIFLEEMNAIVMGYGGAINKYIGDNLMAFWNAPYPQHDHAWLATQAGLDMLTAIHRLNDAARFETPVQFGIGINTGTAVVGNIGSKRRLEYTPIGDTVNVASRLCNVAPGETCYIGARTYDLIADRARPVEVHHLLLKGKEEAVTIYELRPDSVVTVDAAPVPAS